MNMYIIRHAKSSWNFEFDDFDRPLGERGRRDVLKMAWHIADKFPKPEKIITSPASRALYTALHFADAWGYPEDKIIAEDRLYSAYSDMIVRLVLEYPNQHIALFGHNPGLTDFANRFRADIENIPTCGFVHLTDKGRQAFISPKMI
jgi:phosphohistidine phosphatase